MTEITIIGTTTYVDLSGGFWGIKSADGKRWRPVNMPTQLQTEGLNVQVIARKSTDVVSIFMWGTAIEIVSFHTI